MPIICFFGPDGSGKSTLARKLLEVLLARGLRVKACWMRGTHTLASLLARFLAKFKTFRGSYNPYYEITIPMNLRGLWQFIEFASVLPLILFRFVLPDLFGFWVIADRCSLDFIVWVSLVTGDHNYSKSFEARFLTALTSKTYAKVYVTASFKELLRRNGISINFLRDQLKLYDMIASTPSIYELNTTTKRIDDSFRELLNVLEAQKIW